MSANSEHTQKTKGAAFEAPEHLPVPFEVLWPALDRVVTTASEKGDFGRHTEPTTDELEAYSAGTLAKGRIEPMREFLALCPRALAVAGEPSGLWRAHPSNDSSLERSAVWTALRRSLQTHADLEPFITRIEASMASCRDGADSRSRDLRTVDGVREFVVALCCWIGELNALADLPTPLARNLKSALLQSSMPVFALYRARLFSSASQCLLWQWRILGGFFGARLPGPGRVQIPEYMESQEETADGPEFRAFQATVFEVLRDEGAQRSGRATLAEFMSKLELTYAQVAQMLDVSVEAVREWYPGAEPIPPEKLAMLSVAGDSLDRLVTMFQPDRLPQIIRRNAQLFDGQSALDWILQGRTRDVADRYDTLLRYQS